MKRKEFIETWTKIRASYVTRWLREKTMRKSEAVMLLADLPKEAAKLWRRNVIKWGLRTTTPAELIREMMPHEGKQKPTASKAD